MSGQDTLRSINCTSCGAGLSVLGGGRVAAQVCDYCGAVLDATDAYKVLAQYRGMERPSTPFTPGMRGQIDGVEWLVIGTLGMTETYEGRTWRWVEHQLYSPTHGYCWLSVEDGHFVFTRKLRGLGRNGFFTTAQIEGMENRPTTYRGDERFAYYDSGTSEIDFAEGSFNWVPRKGDHSRYVTLLGDTAMLTHLESPSEREVERSTYLDWDTTCAAFGLADAPRPKGVHPLQPFRRWRHGDFLLWSGGLTAAAALVLWLNLISTGQVILNQPAQSVQGGVTAGFTLTNTTDLVEIEIESNANNAWGWYDIALIGPQDQLVTEFGRETGYYQGVEDGESWSEGSRRATARLRLAEPGDYEVTIEQSESGIWQNGRAPSTLSVRVTEGVKAASWMLFAALLSAIAGVSILARRTWHRKRRWADSDWEDD